MELWNNGMIEGFHANSLNVFIFALCFFCVFFAFTLRETYSADLQLLKPDE
jgi:hypothetical protein